MATILSKIANNTIVAMSLIQAKLAMKGKAYKLAGRMEFRGLPISIESKKGQTRKGIGADGKPWEVTMPFDYGYIRGTEGADGQHVDCFIGPNEDAENVFVIHLCKEDDKSKYDEDKVMLGFDSLKDAIAAYKSAYTGVDLFKGSHTFNFEDFVEAINQKSNRGEPLECSLMEVLSGGPGSGRHKGIHPDVPPGKQHECQTNAARVFKTLGHKVVVGRIQNLEGPKLYKGAGAHHVWNITSEGMLYDSTLGSKEAEKWKYTPEKILDSKTAKSAKKIDESFYAFANTKDWIGFDLDGTLAYYEEWEGPTVIGKPIPAMIEILKQHIANGETVKILTARVAEDPDSSITKAIQDWCLEHIGVVLPVTNEKDQHMKFLYDDKAVAVEENTGKLLSPEIECTACEGGDCEIHSGGPGSGRHKQFSEAIKDAHTFALDNEHTSEWASKAKKDGLTYDEIHYIAHQRILNTASVYAVEAKVPEKEFAEYAKQEAQGGHDAKFDKYIEAGGPGSGWTTEEGHVSHKTKLAPVEFEPVYKKTAKKEQMIAEANEATLAVLLGGKSYTDSQPLDIVVQVHGRAIGIEVKTIMHQKLNEPALKAKLTMNHGAIPRKLQWAKKTGAELYTVALDMRDTKMKCYIRQGCGSWRLEKMTAVGGLGGIKKWLEITTKGTGPDSFPKTKAGFGVPKDHKWERPSKRLR